MGHKERSSRDQVRVFIRAKYYNVVIQNEKMLKKPYYREMPRPNQLLLENANCVLFIEFQNKTLLTQVLIKKVNIHNVFMSA